MLLAYLVSFRKAIARTSFSLLIVAGLFFAISLGVDRLEEDVLPWHHLFEDGSKFFGIVSWFGYYLTVCLREIGTLAPSTE
jgi:hypothetical protein